jgi:hypothetical protein
MFCIYCKRPTTDDATYCPGCGKTFQRDKPLPITCTSCRASNPDDAIFCWSCGHRLQKDDNGAGFVLPVPPLTEGVQPAAGNAPMVHGVPQAGGVPMVHGISSPLDASSMGNASGQSLTPGAASGPGGALSPGAALGSGGGVLSPGAASTSLPLNAGSSAPEAAVSSAAASFASSGTQSVPFSDPAPRPVPSPLRPSPSPQPAPPPPVHRPTPGKPRSPIPTPVIILGTVVIVVIIAGALLVNVFHFSLPGSGGTPGVVPQSTACSGSTCTKSTPVSKPGVVPTSFTISGAVTGTWKVNTGGARCLTKQDQTFNWGALGLFNGQDYGFIFAIPSAHAGSYSPNLAVLENQGTSEFKDGTSDVWQSQPKGTVTLTIASDGAISGTMDVVIQGTAVISNVPGTVGTPFPAPASVHVTGNWTCNGYR